MGLCVYYNGREETWNQSVPTALKRALCVVGCDRIKTGCDIILFECFFFFIITFSRRPRQQQQQRQDEEKIK